MTVASKSAVRLCLATLIASGLYACGSHHDDPKGGAPASAAASAAAAASEAKPAGTPLEEAFAKAASCVEKGRVNRGCDGYAALAQTVNLQRHDPDIVKGLLTAAEGTDAAHKSLALTLLARPFPDEGDAAARLLKLLQAETDPTTKADLVDSLTPRTGAGVPEEALKLLTTDKEPGVRAAAARLLGSKAHESLAAQAKPALLKALQEDQAPAVRRNSATSLGNLGATEALPDLIKALDDQLVAPAATFALARFDVPEAYDAIWSRIEASAKDDPKAGPQKVSLPLLASIRLLERHPKHDAKKEQKILEKLKKTLEKRTGDPTAQAALKLIERNIDRLSGKVIEGAAPMPGSAAAVKTPPASKAPASKAPAHK